MRGVNSVLLVGKQVGEARPQEEYVWLVIATEGPYNRVDHHLVYTVLSPPGGPGVELIVEGRMRRVGPGQPMAIEARKVDLASFP